VGGGWPNLQSLDEFSGHGSHDARVGGGLRVWDAGTTAPVDQHHVVVSMLQ